MTVAYHPATQWAAETMRDSALELTADAFDQVDRLREKYVALDPLSDEAAEMGAEVHVAERKALELARIAVRRHRLCTSV